MKVAYKIEYCPCIHSKHLMRMFGVKRPFRMVYNKKTRRFDVVECTHQKDLQNEKVIL